MKNMKRIIDERGRLFGVISIIDVIVLVAVIILGFAVFARIDDQSNPLSTVNTVPVTYTVRFPAVRYTVAELIQPGDSLYNDSGIFIGTVRNVHAEDAEVIESILDGTFVIAGAQERYDVTLTVEVQSTYSNGRYYADRVFELNANSEHRFITKYASLPGYIMTITEE
jgi:hypothetical protein